MKGATSLSDSQQFFLRAFTYACAFVGAGWFGDAVYMYGWAAVPGFIITPAVIAGVVTALLLKPQRNQDGAPSG
jgi:hypothetical protein